MYCVYLGQAKQTVNAPDGSVGSSQVAASIITGQTALGATPADTDELLISDAGTLKRIDYSYLKSANTPAFLAFRSSDQGNVSDNTWTKVSFNSEKFDTDNTYDTGSGKKFTPGVSGKYKLFAQVGGYGQSGGIANTMGIRIYKNGTDEVETRRTFDGAEIAENATTAITVEAILDSNTTDYFEVYWYINTNGNTNATIDYNATKLYTYFGGYRIIE